MAGRRSNGPCRNNHGHKETGVWRCARPGTPSSADGTVLNEGCHPVPDCDCVLDGHSYTPNLQIYYGAASHGFVGKLTCNYHP